MWFGISDWITNNRLARRPNWKPQYNTFYVWLIISIHIKLLLSKIETIIRMNNFWLLVFSNLTVERREEWNEIMKKKRSQSPLCCLINAGKVLITFNEFVKILDHFTFYYMYYLYLKLFFYYELRLMGVFPLCRVMWKLKQYWQISYVSLVAKHYIKWQCVPYTWLHIFIVYLWLSYCWIF